MGEKGLFGPGTGKKINPKIMGPSPYPNLLARFLIDLESIYCLINFTEPLSGNAETECRESRLLDL